MLVKWVSAAAVLAAAACGTSAQEGVAPSAPPRLEEVWRVDGLAAPESAALSADGAFLYVTNVNGEGDAKDGNGFISRISTGGEIIEREFARGLDAPKGIMLGGDSLYVADIDALVVLDAHSGAVRRRIAIPDAVFLNDVAFAPDGSVLISDSGGARIYRVRGDDAVDVWMEGELLQAVNGILLEGDRLIVSTMAGRLLRLRHSALEEAEVIADGLGDGDGIGALGDGRYLVTEWPGRMYFVTPSGTQTLLDTREAGILLNDTLLVGDMLYQPNWAPGSVTAYRVVR